MSLISTDMNALPAHLRRLFEQAGTAPGGTSAVGGYGTGVAPTTGFNPATGGYISPFGGSPYPWNVDTGGAGSPSKPGGYGATPPAAPAEVLPSQPIRTRPLSRTRMQAMQRGYRPSSDASRYLPRNYVAQQMRQQNIPTASQNYYG